MKRLTRWFCAFILLFLATRGYGQQAVSTPRFQHEFLEYINRVRAKGCNCGITYMPPAAPLSWNDQLEVAAMGHAEDMSRRGYFSHTSLDGRTMQNRIGAAGYTYKGYKSYAIGENIAQGPETIAEVIEGWFKSPGHCENLMNRQFKEIGIAKYRDYWVQDFGGRETFSPEMQRMIKSGKYHLVEPD